MIAVDRERTATGAAGQARTLNLVAFRLADQVFGLPAESIREVVPLPLLSRPANAPRTLAGFFDLAGTAVAVVRMDRLLGFEARTPGLYSPLLVTRQWGFPAALLVDSVLGFAPIREHDVLPIDAGSSFNGCTVGMASWAGHRLIALSPARLLLEAERQTLADFSAQEAARLAEAREAAP